MCINVRQGLTFLFACGNVMAQSNQDKRSAQENSGMPLTEGVTLSGVPMGTRTVRGCDSGEALNGVPKVQSGPAANLSGKRTEVTERLMAAAYRPGRSPLAMFGPAEDSPRSVFCLSGEGKTTCLNLWKPHFIPLWSTSTPTCPATFWCSCSSVLACSIPSAPALSRSAASARACARSSAACPCGADGRSRA